MNKQIKTILIDLSGTLHIDNLAICGAQEALCRLRSTDKKIKFVTNTTKESKNVLYNRLKNLGFDIKKEEIFSSLAAARQTIIKRCLNPYLLIDSAAMEDFEDLIKVEKQYDSVVIGLAPEKFNYDDLNNAFRLILNGASLIAIHEGRYYKRPDGLSLGPGAFVKGLEYAANTKAEIIGKPSGEFFRAALEDISPEEAIMIGDDVKDDIAGAMAVGMRGILVQTGKYRPGDENTITPSPTKVCKSFVEAVDEILNNQQ